MLKIVKKPATYFAVLTLSAIGPTAVAAETYPKPIQAAVDSMGVKVVKSFPAASGLTGWVIAQGTRHSLVYTTQDKKTLLVGMMIGEDGRNLSAEYEDRYVPKPDFSNLYGELGKSSYVTEGPAKNPKSMIYVFVDANCPFCHFTWKALQPYEKAGLQVRWIPVATLTPTSMPKAIAVLAAADKSAAFREMEEAHGKKWEASLKWTEAKHPEVAARIKSNGVLMEKFGIAGTPGVVWKDKNGKVSVKGGMPPLKELPAITGLPEQKITDPALDRFR